MKKNSMQKIKPEIRTSLKSLGFTDYNINIYLALLDSGEMNAHELSKKTGVQVHPHLLRYTFATLWLKNGGDSLMLQRLLGHTTLMMTNRYCQAVGCYDAVEAHKRYSPVDGLK